MAVLTALIFPFSVVVFAAVLTPRHASALTRQDFPEGFVFGAGSSAYQVEGAAAEDGRRPSIWDTFTHQGYSFDGTTADVSADQYHHYKATQGGQMGITLLGWWHEPATNTVQDAAAAVRMNDFHIGWFMYPLVYGDYPPVMRNRVGDRLPSLTAQESEKVCGSFDFVGFNHYLIIRVRSIGTGSSQNPVDYYGDAAVEYPSKDISKGEVETAPWSLGKLLEHLKLRYRNPPVWIHENGYADAAAGEGALREAEYDGDDHDRAEFLQDYVEALYLSIRNGSDARGYFVWSFVDVFEYLFGYSMRFGLCGVDMNSQGRTRYERSSARWYSGFLHGGELRPIAPQSQKSLVE